MLLEVDQPTWVGGVVVTDRRVVAQHFIPPHKHHTVSKNWADLQCHCGMAGSQESLIRRWSHFLKIFNQCAHFFIATLFGLDLP